MDGQVPITLGTQGGMSLGTPTGTVPGTMAGTALGATVGGAITGITTGDGDPTIMIGAGPTLTMTGLLIVLTDPILT